MHSCRVDRDVRFVLIVSADMSAGPYCDTNGHRIPLVPEDVELLERLVVVRIGQRVAGACARPGWLQPPRTPCPATGFGAVCHRTSRLFGNATVTCVPAALPFPRAGCQ